LSINPNHRAGKWKRVTHSHPCPICGKPEWCSVSGDGRLAACRRVEQGGRTKTDKDGAAYYLHRLNGTDLPAAPPPIPSEVAVDRADADTLHAVYSALLARLSLSAAHRADLQRRGLADVEIDRRAYRTLPVQGRAPLARELREWFGDSVLRVPGIISRERDGRRYLTLAGAAGLLIPVRDVAGRIVALKIRRDEADGGRYSFLSSAKYGGPGSGAPVHVPAGIQGPTEIVRLTEGELKADVAFVRTGLPTISTPGVSSWRACLPVLKAMGCKIVRLALDGDAKDKAAVARALDACAEALAAEGFAVELERWPAEHKGIDDALAAGAAVEILTGDAARQAIAEIVAEGTAGEPPQEAGPLGRWADALAAGAETLFRDRELLQGLAKLAETEPAEYACRRAQARTAGVRLRELDTALAPLRREIRAANPPPTAAGEYRISGGRIVHLRSTQNGAVEVPLGNFWARIVETVTRDDGAESFTAFVVEGALVDGRPLPRVTIKSSDFPRMEWPTSAWQGRAVVFAGLGTRDHLRCAIELLSTDRAERVEYLHTGWREIGGRWVYLHAGGAIGADGPAEGIAVALPAALSRFELPAPSEGKRLADAVRASLRLLDLGPPRIAFPLLAAVYRAVLGPCDFSLHACGPTGVFKSEFSALCQQHFGAGLDARHLPGSWSSTGNSLEALGFAAKDALLVVDDFAPSGSTADVQRFHRDADRFLRAVGNAAGRGRCRSDATLVQGKPPRGLPLSTGEDIPRGQSLRARLLVLEFTDGDVDAARLTACQRDAAAGLYAEALAGFLRWLAPRYQGIRDGLRAEVAELREKALAGIAHRRTPEIVASLFIGLKHLLAFAEDAGAITAADKAELLRRAWDALGEAAAAQAEHVQAADPVGHFLRLLAGALASGRAHCAAPNGDAPAEAAACGWREHEIGTGESSRLEWRPQGKRIGWIDGGDLLLEPEAAYAEAQELARSQGDSIPISPRTLWRRLRERGLLASCDSARQHYTVRRRLDGYERREVIHLRADALCAQQPSPPSPPSPDPAKHGENGDGSGDGCTLPAADRPREPSLDLRESCGETDPGTGGDGGDGHANIGPPAVERIPRTVCRNPQHRQRWRSVHGVVLCGICVRPVNEKVVAEWLDGPPAK
jgi:hypothetical protein